MDGLAPAGNAAALRDGTLNARDLIEEAIARHEKWDAQLGAYKTWNADYAREQAKAADAAFIAGQDHGPAQDSIFGKGYLWRRRLSDLRGVPQSPATGMGTGRYSEPAFETTRSRPGKTHTVGCIRRRWHEPHWPTPRNPWDMENHRAPGGSSSGAGVSLHGVLLQSPLGPTQAGQSECQRLIREMWVSRPQDRWSTDGITILSTSFDTPGILAKYDGHCFRIFGY